MEGLSVLVSIDLGFRLTLDLLWIFSSWPWSRLGQLSLYSLYLCEKSRLKALEYFEILGGTMYIDVQVPLYVPPAAATITPTPHANPFPYC